MTHLQTKWKINTLTRQLEDLKKEYTFYEEQYGRHPHLDIIQIKMDEIRIGIINKAMEYCDEY